MVSDMDDGREQAGVLTPEQRAFLRDGPDDGLSDGAIRQRRYRIRKRVRSALLDFELLQRIPPEDRDQIFDDVADTPAGFSIRNQFDEAVLALLRFVYRGVGPDVFQYMVELELRQSAKDVMLFEKDVLADVDVEVSVETENERPVEELKERFDAGMRPPDDEQDPLPPERELDDDELYALYLKNRVTKQEILLYRNSQRVRQRERS
jgi:hypothetical protein